MKQLTRSHYSAGVKVWNASRSETSSGDKSSQVCSRVHIAGEKTVCISLAMGLWSPINWVSLGELSIAAALPIAERKVHCSGLC